MSAVFRQFIPVLITFLSIYYLILASPFPRRGNFQFFFFLRCKLSYQFIPMDLEIKKFKKLKKLKILFHEKHVGAKGVWINCNAPQACGVQTIIPVPIKCPSIETKNSDKPISAARQFFPDFSQISHECKHLHLTPSEHLRISCEITWEMGFPFFSPRDETDTGAKVFKS